MVVEGGSTAAFKNTAEEQANGTLHGAYNNLTISRGTGGFGSASVEGVGSLLTASGGAARITVGRDGGSSSLNISDGGTVGTFNLTVGRNNSRGIVSIDGAGSELRLGFDYGTYDSAYGGSTRFSAIGRQFNGQGILAIQDGGAVLAPNNDGVTDGGYLCLGRDEDSAGYAVVSGVGSTLSLNQVGTLD